MFDYFGSNETTGKKTAKEIRPGVVKNKRFTLNVVLKLIIHATKYFKIFFFKIARQQIKLLLQVTPFNDV